ncbi:hypothetical protein ACVOMV_15770 [Mesorhizobium atlanticum]
MAFWTKFTNTSKASTNSVTAGQFLYELQVIFEPPLEEGYAFDLVAQQRADRMRLHRGGGSHEFLAGLGEREQFGGPKLFWIPHHGVSSLRFSLQFLDFG